MQRFLIALIVLLCAGPALAREEIREFNAIFEVHADTSVTITEQIAVNAEGNEIRRGIFRDIPTLLETPDGRTIRLPFEVISVTRNGAAEPFAVEAISGGQRIRIGSADVLLRTGVHRYEIVYRMDRAARMFADHDEFYWNATGNYWSFPILRARALVTLPQGAQITEINAYTGEYGVRSADNSAERLNDRQARFTMSRVLGPGEGLTVSVSFEKGILAAPQGTDALVFWFSDYRDYIVPLAMLLIVIAYNALAWGAVGRDPAKGVIFPRFYPPKGFSPALVHYVHTMGWGKSGWTAFSSALISLATKGLIEIGKQCKKNTLTVTGQHPKDPLPPGEAVIYGDLKSMSPVTIDKSSGPKLGKTKTAFVAALEAENRRVYFNNHVPYIIFGVLIAIAALLLMVLTGVLHPLFVFFAAFAAVFLSIIGTAARSFWQGQGIGRFFGLAIMGIFFANSGAFALDVLDFASIDFPFVAAITIIAVTLVFAILMRAPTVHGRKVMDEIDGFKMYLEIAEKERLNLQGEPEMSVSRFEAILPYAMALGVEKPWSTRFENDLARHAVKDAGPDYAPHWYRGGNFSSGGFARTMGGVATGLSAAMISSQPQASSSSGSGGGGFSGGGGGGGGGGGW
ncbi:DUF2207 domain-containing protein [Pelagibacterium halotolerans]|uniref:Transmembrane protein n=1 Tax=Pelagibacterium halotolerans (strain DSM 22347 / JCM 15775 / CGMCC 1.7692 / B2) TaxID=1082931 RepID=G4RBR9_PELHB|nr:DUF2207 domain-containing protein [Pelagibacterium halotolerans]AEQ50582.1 hypothetical protein KKY_541 [Pelagibacterium halotolerans B2]QJR19472.1 DUF2207 domain-containing protein [Pelagibacterium halotolerans]SDZ90330.1 Predicted membrane protein [Pelagibacterium halotolerans]